MTVLLALAALLQITAADPAALFQEGRYAEAESAARAALKSAPSDARLLTLLAAVLDSTNRFDEAEGVHRRLTTLRANAPQTWNNFGNHWLRRGKLASALQSFQKALALQPDHPNANAQAARILVSQGRAAEAVAYLDRAGAESTEDTALLALYGRALASNRQLPKAEEVFRRALRTAPGSREIRVALGLVALNAGEPQRALEILEAVHRQHPRDPDVLLAVAQVWLATGRSTQALAALGEARRADPKRSDVLELLARTASDLGFHQDAAAAWSEYLKLEPAAAQARRERAFALVRARDARGLPELEAYVAKSPSDAIGRYQLGIAYAPGDAIRAIEQLDRSLAISADNADALYVRGTLLSRENRVDEARSDLQRAVALNPRHAAALTRLGQVLRASGELVQAEDALRRAIALNPDDRAALMHLGFVLRTQGKSKEAEPLFAKLKGQLGTEQSSAARGGLLDFLSLDPERQRSEYLANLKSAVAERQDDDRLRLHLGMELLSGGGVAGAQQEFQQLRDAASMREAAAALVRARHSEPALALLKESGATAEYWLARAQLLESEDQFPAAVEAMNRAIATSPDRAFVYVECYKLLAARQRFAEAAALLEKAVDRLPDERQLRLDYATALELSNRYGQARQVLSAIQQRWPEWARPYVVHAISFMTRGKAAEAIPLLERALALGENSAEVHYYYALALTELAPEKKVLAKQAVGRALELAPDDPFILTFAGRLAINDGRHEDALKLLDESLKLRPAEAETHYQRMRAYNALGRRTEAKAEAAIVRKLRETEGAAAAR